MPGKEIMKGKYRVIVENRRIKYDFEIRRNITVIKGDSATGKTTLVEMIAEYYENGPDSGILLQCERVCTVLEGRNWKVLLTAIHESIIFIDEGNDFLKSYEFASAIQGSDNYFVLVCREALPMLPYSVTEIYGIRNSGKYGSLRRVYNEMYQIYSRESVLDGLRPDTIVVEDSNAGFQFFDFVCSRSGTKCISAGGKTKIFRLLCDRREEKVLAIADGAAFGSEMEKVMALARENVNIYLYLPESFEWLLLDAGIVKDGNLKDILDNTADYVPSETYSSWERFYTELLVQLTRGTYLAYTKSALNPAYLQGNIPEKILHGIGGKMM